MTMGGGTGPGGIDRVFPEAVPRPGSNDPIGEAELKRRKSVTPGESMPTSKELKPCPFCGAKAELGERDPNHPEGKFYVLCSSRRCNARPLVNGERKHSTIAAWNRRDLE